MSVMIITQTQDIYNKSFIKRKKILANKTKLT